MKSDNFRLIVEVEKRRSLWDSTMHMGARKDAGIVLWQEVAEIMKLEVHICKKRFKGLRDSYRAEVRKIQKGQITHSNWPYFRALEFMRIIFDPDKLVPFPPELINIPVNLPICEQNQLDDFIIDVDNDDSFDFEIMGDIFKRESTNTLELDTMKPNCEISSFNTSAGSLNRSDVETSFSIQSSLPVIEQCTKRARLCRSPEGPYVIDRTAPSKSSPCISSEMPKDDPDYNFLVSLLPHMKTLSNMNNMKFRTEVSRMLMNLNQQEREPSDHSQKAIPAAPKVQHGRHLQSEPDSTKYNVPNSRNGSPYLTHSSIVECDVKIENELI